MSMLELVEHMNECERYAKKLKLEPYNRSILEKLYSVKCMDVLKVLRGTDAEDECCDRCRHSSISPPFPSRRNRRVVLKNRTNVNDSKYSVPTSESLKERIRRDASHPGTIQEMIAKVPDVEKFFTVKRRIGWGTFSSVFLATSKQINIEEPKKNYALKHVYSSSGSAKRILFETKCLREIGRCNNVIGLDRIINNGPEHVLAMPYYRHDRFSTIIKSLSFNEVREYMKNLLLAIRRVHKFNVIHRDVKPSNFLYDTKTKRCALIDFGLAHNAYYYLPTKKSSMPSPAIGVANTTCTPLTVHVATQKPATPKGLATRSVHNRNSLMVAMAINKQRQESRKRSQGNACESEVMAGTPSKAARLLVDPETRSTPKCPRAPTHSGTPRPTTHARHTLGVWRHPVPIPCHSMPSPLSAGSEITLTSPLGGGSTGGHLAERTLGELLPEVKKRLKNVQISSNENDHQQKNAEQRKCYKCSASKKTVPRAGTSGFRAPEVLIHCPHQTTAVDIWSAGVMFLSLLSGRYPFFKPVDDLESLVQLVALFGTEKLKELARTCGKKLSAPYYCSGHDIRSVVEHFRKIAIEQTKLDDFVKPTVAAKTQCEQSDLSNPHSQKPIRKPVVSQHYPHRYNTEEIPCSAYRLLERLLDVNPMTRITAKDALNHKFFTDT